MRYEFTLVLDREPIESELEDMFENGFDDAAFEGGNEYLAHFEREADSLADAIAHAVHQLEENGFRVVAVQSEDLVTLKDIAQRTDRTYESVRLLAAGKRGPGGFPAALSEGPWAFYSWTLVSRWFAEHHGSSECDTYSREIAAADHLIRARHMLDAQERVELSKLVTA